MMWVLAIGLGYYVTAWAVAIFSWFSPPGSRSASYAVLWMALHMLVALYVSPWLRCGTCGHRVAYRDRRRNLELTLEFTGTHYELHVDHSDCRRRRRRKLRWRTRLAGLARLRTSG